VVKKTVAKPTPKKAAAKPIAKAVVKKSPAKPLPKTSAKKAVPAKPIAKAPVKKPSSAKPVAKTPTKKVAAKALSKPVAKTVAKPSPSAKPVAKVATSKQVAAPAKVAAVVAPKTTTPPAKKFTPKKTTTPPVADITIIVEPITDPKFLAFTQKQKQRLLDLRDEIVDAMTGSAREAIRSSPEGSEASGSGMHQGDAGSDAYDRDFALSVLAKDQDALYEIEEALLRIKKGTYGLCEMSGKRIPIPRLEAIPFARLTVECQSQWEKEYGTKKFRPSGSVGFSGGGIFEEDEDSDTISLDEDED
jgi:RNA polymerase-binding transcription factor DksA